MPDFCVTHIDTGETRTSRERGLKEPTTGDLLEALVFCELNHLTVTSRRSNLILQVRMPGK